MKISLALIIFLVISNAFAMTIETQGTVVFASGPVVEDLRKFEEAFAKPGIDTVVFVNSPGGDLWTGLRVGRLIADRGLKTIVAGTCVSACSIMFMGGKERQFSNAFPPKLTYVGIHGAHHNDTNQVDPILQPQIFSFFKQRMGAQFNTAIINQALYDMDDRGSLLRVFDAERIPKITPYHCRATQTIRKNCTEIANEDALSLGIVTHRELATVALPPAFRAESKIMGWELTTPLINIVDMLAEMSRRKCVSEKCKVELSKWAYATENKAIATRVDGPGYGASQQRDTLVSAMIGAVYQCNYLKDRPVALCEAQIVNGYDVSGIYRDAIQSHKDALSKLELPSGKFFANEEFGGGFTSVDGYRIEKIHDITPQKVDGIRTVGTQELVRLIKADKPPVVINVWGGANEVIPSSVALLYGGLAFADPQAEQTFNERFRGMMSVVVPSQTQPVVFYCEGRNCWLSLNAAMRAVKAGYQNVLWYRGGWESWKAAALPSALIAIRAVVN